MIRYIAIVALTIAGIFGIMAINVAPANAGIFDKITTIVGGHTADLVSRFADDEMLEDVTTLKSGLIDVDAVGQDFAHNASGTISLVEKDGKRYIQLGADFKSSPGPDYHVYASVDVDINEEADFNKATQVELGKLIKGSGATYYEVPEGVDVNSVTIWCKAFGAYIGSADLEVRMTASEMMEQMMDEPLQGEDMK